jgi:siroheme synthase
MVRQLHDSNSHLVQVVDAALCEVEVLPGVVQAAGAVLPEAEHPLVARREERHAHGTRAHRPSRGVQRASHLREHAVAVPHAREGERARRRHVGAQVAAGQLARFT